MKVYIRAFIFLSYNLNTLLPLVLLQGYYIFSLSFPHRRESKLRPCEGRELQGIGFLFYRKSWIPSQARNDEIMDYFKVKAFCTY